MPEFEVVHGEDASLMVRVFANKFRKALQSPAYARKVREFSGSFGMSEPDGRNGFTISVGQGRIELNDGGAEIAPFSIKVDFNNPVKASVRGLLRHPRQAQRAGQLLAFPTPHWIDAVKRFWDEFHDYPDMPGGIRFVATDENREFKVGEAADACRIEGPSAVLAEVFHGDSVLLEKLFTGKLRCDASLQHLIVLSDVGGQLLLGDLP